jgi:hypothetical protein
MTPGEIAFLALVGAAFLLFAVVVACVDWYARPNRRSAKQSTRTKAPALDVSPPRAAAH